MTSYHGAGFLRPLEECYASHGALKSGFARSGWRRRDRQYQFGWMRSIVMDRVAADLVGTIVMRPQYLGCRRITVDDLDTETMTLLDKVSHRFKADLKFVDLVRRQRLRISVAVVRHHVCAACRVDGAVRCAQPAARDEFRKRV